MKKKDKDALILAAAVERLNKFRLPRALSLKKKVDSGELLNDFDLNFLRRSFDNARDLKPFLERNPDYLKLRDKALGLCEQILQKNAENQSD
jgi:hypothetical protein